MRSKSIERAEKKSRPERIKACNGTESAKIIIFAACILRNFYVKITSLVLFKVLKIRYTTSCVLIKKPKKMLDESGQVLYTSFCCGATGRKS